MCLILVCFVYCCNSECVGNVTTATYVALEDLYYSLNGKYWFWHAVEGQDDVGSVWMFPSSLSAPCAEINWFGIECVKSFQDTCDIVAVELPIMNATGTLPPSAFNLTRLKLFDLMYNSVFGAVQTLD